MRSAADRQRGVALITAILIVSVCSILAVSMMFRAQLDIRRAQNLVSGDQAYLYTLGAESLAKVMLVRDIKQNRIDHIEEQWALPIAGLPIEHGILSGKLDDLQGRFNLNNLIDGGVISSVDTAQFSRLLRLLNLDPNLSQAVVDWIDADLEATIPSGAEDDLYLLDAKMPYRAANQLMKSVSELVLIKGFDAETVAKLEPYVCALPERTALNVNTASALLLASLSEKISPALGEKLVAARVGAPFQTVESFTTAAQLDDTQIDTSRISVASQYFQLRATATFDRASAQVASLIQRKSDKDIKVVMRSRGAI